MGFFTSTLGPSVAGVAGAVNAGNLSVNNTLHNVGTYTVNGYQQVNQTTLGAQHSADATLPNQSAACQWAAVGQAKGLIDQNVVWLAAAHGTMMGADCKGSQANCPGPGRKWEQLNDLCQLGFLNKTEYGTLLKNMSCPDPPDLTGGNSNYWDRDENLAAGLAAYQMPLPPSVCVLPDGYLSFTGPTNSKIQCQPRYVGFNGAESLQRRSHPKRIGLDCFLQSLRKPGFRRRNTAGIRHQ